MSVKSEDIEALTSAIYKLLDEVSSSSHHIIDALNEISTNIAGAKEELAKTNETLDSIGFGGQTFQGPLEKSAMHLEQLARKALSE